MMDWMLYHLLGMKLWRSVLKKQIMNLGMKKVEPLLKKCQQIGVLLKREKSKLHCSSKTFPGETLTKAGLHFDPEKASVIPDMPASVETHDVQQYVGMVSYLARFLYENLPSHGATQRADHQRC